MKITIFGAGAIGCHMAAKLAKAGTDFTLVARPAVAEAIRRDGLHFISSSEDFTCPIPVSDNSSQFGHQDAVIVAIKAHSVPAALPDLMPLIGVQTIVVFAVNGVPWWYGLAGAERIETPEGLDPGGRLARDIGLARTIGCVVQSGNEMIGPTTVHNTSPRNRFTFGAADPRPFEALEILACTLAPGLGDVRIVDDIRQEVWAKILINLPNSAISSLTRGNSSRIAANAPISELYLELRREVYRVAGSLNVDLEDNAEAMLANLATLKEHRCSMLQDVLAGRQLEVGAQISAVRQIAEQRGVATPNIVLLSHLLQALDENLGLPGG